MAPIESAVVDGELVVVQARAALERAASPACGTVPGRVHGRYVRCLADLAVAVRPVLIELQVRRFRCRHRACRQATFAEQVDGLTFRHRGEAPGCRQCCNRQRRCRLAEPAAPVWPTSSLSPRSPAPSPREAARDRTPR
ncbi:hypothetical protein GRC12_39805 [Streptomyces griseorubiginosus]|nr:hypothetical protein [Streptomyces griseorubiginosus]